MAIMVTPKLANLPDVTTTTPSDGQVLTYDDGTGKWVNDDAASGGLATDGSTTGATAQAQPFTVGISLTDTTTATTGVVFKGATRFLHNFHHPTGGGAVPNGYNVFVGEEAGNFTLGSTATASSHGSANIGIGRQSMRIITTGYNNVAVGDRALFGVTTGFENIAVGSGAQLTLVSGIGNVAIGAFGLYANVSGVHNMAVGTEALRFTTGNNNVGVGRQSAYGNTTGSSNVAIGYWSLRENTTGSNNVAIGTAAGRYQANATALTDAENSVYIGHEAYGLSNADSNSIVIGYQAIGTGANTSVIGNTSMTAATIYGAGKFWLRSSATNAVTNIGTLTHNSTGTPAAGFGAGLLFQLETSTTEDQDAARISAVWSDATHATRTGDLVFSTVSGAAALSEKLRLTGAGILKFSGTMGNSTKVPGTDAPADWIEVQIGSDTRYIPVYAAS